MERLKTSAIVLRRTPYRDHDLVVDLLTVELGRISGLARSGQRSRKRYGGALELGTRLAIEATRRGAGMLTLGDVQVEAPVNHIRSDLDAINHLYFGLEVARLTAREGASDAGMFGLVAGLIDRLETTGANFEAMIVWELAALSQLGYRLALDGCVVSGGRPDGLSLIAGGAIDLQQSRPPDATPLDSRTVFELERLSRGESGAMIPPVARLELRQAMTAIWQAVTGKTLRTAGFLE